MNDALPLILAGVAGSFLGAIFFGGLWWTVRRGVVSRQPALWFMASLLIRTGITVAGFYFVAGSHSERLIACLVGFLMARFIVMRLTRPAGDTHGGHNREPRHAS